MLSLGIGKLAICDEIKDLGIVIYYTVGFCSYINNTVSCVYASSNLVYKYLTLEDIVTLKQAFLMYVRPLLASYGHINHQQITVYNSFV
jgi:hypothetical protein